MSHDTVQSDNTDHPISADIIILDWNRPDTTIAAIQSALDQTGVKRQIWVVDQGSEPNNRARLAEFCQGKPDVHVHWLDHNVGVAEGRNIATRLGSAPYVIGLDNDAVFQDPECVARTVARFEAQPALGALAFSIVDAGTGEEAPYWDYPEIYLRDPVPSFETTRFLGGGHGLRRSAFERAGGYDAKLFFSGEERDLAWRIINCGYRIRFDRDLVVVHARTTVSKINWTDRRYYLLVRNTLYINHKYGAGAFGFARGAAGFMLRGLRNNLASAVVRGVSASLRMSLQFSLSAEDHSAYRLSPELRRYIADTDHKTHESALSKLRRGLTSLPNV